MGTERVKHAERSERADVRLANEAWEALLTAHATLMRGFADESVWRDHSLTMREYDVLYTLAKHEAPARIGELQQGVLLSQPALSRLVDRLTERGLTERAPDPDDGRSVRVALTEAGHAVQVAVGMAHARSVANAVGGALSTDDLHELLRLTRHLAVAGGATR